MPFTWIHRPSEGVRTAFVDVTSAGAIASSWGPATPRNLRIAALRSLMAATVYTAAQLSSARPFVDGSTVRVTEPTVFPSADHQRLAGALLATPALLSNGQTLGRSFRTTDDGPPETVTDAGAFPVAVQIAIVVAVAGAVAWVAHEAASVVDGQLAREQDTSRLLSTQAAAVAVAEKHAELEAAAGKPLALNDAEKQVLGALEGVQRDIAKKQPANAFNLNLGDFAWPAAALVAAYFLLR